MERLTTTINKKKFLDCLIYTRGNVELAAECSDLSRTQFYDWKKKDEGFNAKYLKILESIVLYTENKLLSKILEDDPNALKRLRKRIHKKLSVL